MQFGKLQVQVLPLLKLSTPIVFAQLGTVLLGLTDTIMLGQFGKNELAAVGLANQIYFLVTVIGMGIMTALTPIVASSKGARNPKECGEFLRSAIELGMLIGFLTFLALIFLSFNFHIFRQPETTTKIASVYLRVLASTTFPLLLFLALKHFNDGISFSRPAMVITFGGVILNIFLNWVFVFGHLTFPAMGAKGAAIATLLTRMLMALGLAYVIFKNKTIRIFLPPLVSTYKTAPVIRKLIKMGFPTGLQIFFEVAAYATLSVMAGWIGMTALAAHQIGLGIVALCYTIATGLCAAASIMTGQAIGENQSRERILAIAFNSIFLTTIVLLLVSAILFQFKIQIIESFTTDQEVLMNVSAIFGILLLFQLVNGIQANSIGILRGLQDVNYPAKLTLVSYWMIGLPLSFFLINAFGYKLEGIWIGLITAGMISLSVLLTRLFNTLKSGNIKTYQAQNLEKA